MTNKTQEQPTQEQDKAQPYRLIISKQNQPYILDLARYFDERPTTILNEIVNHARIETPATLIEHMRQRFLTQLDSESPIQSFKDAIEQKTSETMQTAKDNIKDTIKKAKPRPPKQKQSEALPV